jgi:hypothetical protein
VNAQYNGSIVAKNAFFISPYKIPANDKNGHGYYFKKYNI